MKLVELFSKGAEWEWEDEGSASGSAVFPIGDVFYRVKMQVIVPQNQPRGEREEMLDVAFEAMRFDDVDGPGMTFDDVDSDGNQYAVLSTVFDVVQSWFTKHGVMPIFAEATLKRKRIYAGMFRRKGWAAETRGSRIFGYPPGYQSKQPSRLSSQ